MTTISLNGVQNVPRIVRNDFLKPLGLVWNIYMTSVGREKSFFVAYPSRKSCEKRLFSRFLPYILFLRLFWPYFRKVSVILICYTCHQNFRISSSFRSTVRWSYDLPRPPRGKIKEIWKNGGHLLDSYGPKLYGFGPKKRISRLYMGFLDAES